MRIKIKKGLDLRLAGAVDASCKSHPVEVKTKSVAIYPDDFEGFIPKTDVKPGDKVRLGDALFHHKLNDKIKLVSPACGVVTEILRGERRHIQRISIECNGDEKKTFSIGSLDSETEQIIQTLCESGLFAFLRQRPFNIIPDPDKLPRDIFVTAFDSAPLAESFKLTPDKEKSIRLGAKILSRLSKGKVYISQRPEAQSFVEQYLTDIDNVVNVYVNGPHPAGLVGVQIANIAPVNKNEIVWTLSIDTMWRIGQLFETGCFNSKTNVAVVGSGVQKPFIASTVIGAEIEPIIKDSLDKESDVKMRIISGNVLTGSTVEATEYLRFPYSQITIIPEINQVDEFMGWASLSCSKMSVNRSFPGFFSKRSFKPDCRINGGKRAIIMSGEYDRVLPMGIMAEYLIKAVKSKNIEEMEKLGIYEIAPEDFALAEFVDSSKQPLQNIIREGLEYIRKELQ